MENKDYFSIKFDLSLLNIRNSITGLEMLPRIVRKPRSVGRLAFCLSLEEYISHPGSPAVKRWLVALGDLLCVSAATCPNIEFSVTRVHTVCPLEYPVKWRKTHLPPTLTQVQQLELSLPHSLMKLALPLLKAATLKSLFISPIWTEPLRIDALDPCPSLKTLNIHSYPLEQGHDMVIALHEFLSCHPSIETLRIQTTRDPGQKTRAHRWELAGPNLSSTALPNLVSLQTGSTLAIWLLQDPEALPALRELSIYDLDPPYHTTVQLFWDKLASSLVASRLQCLELYGYHSITQLLGLSSQRSPKLTRKHEFRQVKSLRLSARLSDSTVIPDADLFSLREWLPTIFPSAKSLDISMSLLHFKLQTDKATFLTIMQGVEVKLYWTYSCTLSK
ncbi:hypothetical protein ONZ45_g6508 [Pleurotus djamor]|nr:hypothetical protein ONZ45_g6508 [Pleurotus djamor]